MLKIVSMALMLSLLVGSLPFEIIAQNVTEKGEMISEVSTVHLNFCANGGHNRMEVNMRIFLVVSSMLVMCVLFSACARNAGNTDRADIHLGDSEKFSQSELDAAISCVKNKFKDFKGCELITLYYDEDKSNSEIKSYMTTGPGATNGVEEGNVIVLLSDFKVDSPSYDSGLEPNSTYKDWHWVLIRDNPSRKWKVDSWGY